MQKHGKNLPPVDIRAVFYAVSEDEADDGNEHL